MPLMEMPAFVDERDMVELAVRYSVTIDVAISYVYGRDKMIYRAKDVRTPAGFTTRFAPLQKVLVKYNPFAPEQIWIINRDNGSTIGMAPLHERAPMTDKVAINAAMGLQAHDLAEKVHPARGRHQPEAVKRAKRMANNQAALTGLAVCLPVENQMYSPEFEAIDYNDVPDAMDVAASEFKQDHATV